MNDKTIAFVLYPGLTPLDLIGPLQVMSGLETAEAMFGVQPRHHVVVVAESLDDVPTDTPVRIAATSTLDEVPEPDVVLVPGGGAPTLRQLANPTLLDYLRKVDRTAEVIASVCTGSLILAGAGLLEGRRATTHWAYHRFLNRLGATYVPQRWVEDDRYLTGAGVSAGIDTALQLAARLTNDDLARAVQLGIEYDPHPPHGGIDWTRVDRDMLAPRVEGFAREALAEHPAMLGRLLG
ncbi:MULTISPECIES: DJ-1/PfpI family protein [unclassified Kribbella]|uniref:DJ-1/PfpI family protein n=1 Tax=unclassified Kribbella TaxID=2644121 RepID=UPI0030175D3F